MNYLATGSRALLTRALTVSTVNTPSRSLQPLIFTRFFSLTQHAVDLRLDNVDDEVLNQKLAVVYAHDKSEVSKNLSPVLEKAMKHTAATGKIHYSQIDLSTADKKLLKSLNVSKAPALVVFQKGNEVLRFDKPETEDLEAVLGRVAWLYTT